jgi:hypothetical protein
MKTLIPLIVSFSALMHQSWGSSVLDAPTILASLEFTPDPKLDKKDDAEPPDNPGKYGDAGDRQCGSTETFDLTNAANDEIGILQIRNTGVCKLAVIIELRAPPGTTTPATPIANYSVPSGDVGTAGDVTLFDIPKATAGNLSTVHVKIVCSSSPAGKCSYGYAFSTAKKAKKPTRSKLDIDEPPARTPPKAKESGYGTKKNPNDNPCITDDVIVKTIRNISMTEMVVHFTAQSTCDCEKFEAYATHGGKESDAAAGSGASPTKGNEGSAQIPKRGTIKANPGHGIEADVVYIKVRCPYSQLPKKGPCSGKVTDITIEGK